MTVKELKRAIRDCKAEMKAAGIRRISCFNGGLSSDEYRYNSRIFALNCELEKTQVREALESAKREVEACWTA